LALYGRRHCVLDPGEGVEQGVSLGVDLDPAMSAEGLSQQPTVLRKHPAVAVPQGLEQAGGALDVGEHQGDGPPGQLSHRPSARLLTPLMPRRAADHQSLSVQQGSSLPAATRPTPAGPLCEFPKKAFGTG